MIRILTFAATIAAFCCSGTALDAQTNCDPATGNCTVGGVGGNIATYSAASAAINNSGAGVIFEITGAANHVIRVWSCTVGGFASSATSTEIFARVLSSPDTGGAYTSATVGPLDSANTATAATVVTYATSPTEGAIQTAAYLQPTVLTTTASIPQPVTMNFQNSQSLQAPTLRSASQQFVLFVNQAVTGGVYYANCKFTDTAT